MWYPPRVLVASFSSCIAIYSIIVTSLTLSLSFCWFPCFVICRLFHITHKYCCLQANRSTYDIIMKQKKKTILRQKDFCISPALCADILISRRNYYFLFIVVELLPIDRYRQRYSSKCDCSQFTGVLYFIRLDILPDVRQSVSQCIWILCVVMRFIEMPQRILLFNE